MESLEEVGVRVEEVRIEGAGVETVGAVPVVGWEEVGESQRKIWEGQFGGDGGRGGRTLASITQ